jgi:hypothetical protein
MAVHLCPPPLEAAKGAAELRELVEVQFSTFGSQLEQRLSNDSTSTMINMMRMTGHAAMPARRREGRRVAALEQVFLVVQLEGLGHRVAVELGAADQVTSLRGVCSIDSRPLPAGEVAVEGFLPALTCQ